MHDASDFLNAVKQAAIDAVNESQPTDFYFGQVTSTSPLKIFVEQKMTLSKPQLIVTETVFTTFPLAVGDNVVLLKKKGGQKYLIIDKVVNL